jgi:hypothetical protein
MATAEGSASQDQDRDDRMTRVGRLTRQKVGLVFKSNAVAALPACDSELCLFQDARCSFIFFSILLEMNLTTWAPLC